MRCVQRGNKHHDNCSRQSQCSFAFLRSMPLKKHNRVILECRMGMADIAEVLWNRFLKHAPTHPSWWNRDRFVVSNGHGSMLLYALLHLSGYDLPLEALKHFRQLHSKISGTPEYGETPGVETTTGPLGKVLRTPLAWPSLNGCWRRASINPISI